MASTKIIFITGANRGIGLAILQSLALRSPTDTYLLGCRSLLKGHEAISHLHTLGIPPFTTIIPIELDVTFDSSIRAAVQTISATYGHLDVLVNNVGIAILASLADFSDYRDISAQIYDTNVTSIALCMALFLPLLRVSPLEGQIINISSARASLTLTASGHLPPTVAVAYSVSKTALNALTLLMSQAEENKGVRF